MSNSTVSLQVAEAAAYLGCVARSNRDPDMQGYAVRLSTFIANVMLAILVKWSHDEVTESVGVVLLQVYSILLVTFISMWRGNLSMADAHFALSITVSPLSIYFLYSTLRVCLKKKNTLYDRLGKSKIIVGALTTLMLVLWIILDLLIYFANVFEGETCASPTFIGWFFYRSVTAAKALEITIYFLPMLPLFYLIYALRHFSDIRNEHRRHMRKVISWHSFRWVQTVWFALRSFFVSQWIVITRSHPWTIFLCISLTYMCWAGTLKIWIVDMDFYYHKLLASFHESLSYEPRINYDPLGFGQLLAATVALEPIYAVCVLAWKTRADIGGYLRQFPSSIWNGIVFIVTGHRNPWKIMHEPSLDLSTVQNLFFEGKHGRFISADSFALSDTTNSSRSTPVVTPYPLCPPNQAPSDGRHAKHSSYNITEFQSLLSGASPSPDPVAQMPRPYRPLPSPRQTPEERHIRHSSGSYSPAVDAYTLLDNHSNRPLPTSYGLSFSPNGPETSSFMPYDPPWH
ncbi:hypothetical protein DFS33DRAFT_830386 [Desarmillaria ectypa]|nr:hypothetical protein DFS33DRAFT_830386 [Desarmillaria ectypa]